MANTHISTNCTYDQWCNFTKNIEKKNLQQMPFDRTESYNLINSALISDCVIWVDKKEVGA